MAKQVMDIHPGKGGMTAAQSNEHLRNWDARKWAYAAQKGNYDQTRSHLNFEVARGGKIVPLNNSGISIPKRMKKNLKERGILDPNKKVVKQARKPGVQPREYVTVANIIFGGSRQRMHELAFGNQVVDVDHKNVDHSHITRNKDIENWALDVYDFACKQWGEENIIGFCVHLDEMNPHIHCSVLPIDQHGKFNYNMLFNSLNNKNIFDKYHDDFAKINEKWGLDRGDPVAVTGARHRSTEEYRRELSSSVINLQGRKEQLDQQIEDMEFELANNHYSLDQLMGEYNTANRRVKGLTSMLEQLERKHTEALAELDKLRVQGEAREDVLTKKQKELQRILDNIERKSVELDAANRKLELLTDKKTEMQDQLNDIGKKIEESRSFLNLSLLEKANVNLQRVAGAALNEVLGALDNIYETMTPKEAQMFEGTIIEDLMQNSDKILKCATFLFMEMPLQASNYSVSVGGSGGGGGGGSDSWWKKKDDDEDDLAYARRCFFGAMKLIQPAKKKKVKR